MQEFTVRPDSFREIEKRLVKTMAIIFGSILVLVLGLPVLISGDPGDLGTLPYMVVLFGALFAFSIWNSIKKQRALFDSFKLVIDDEKITRERLNTPLLIIYKKDVQRIIKSSSGAFCIEGGSKLNPIGIPAQIDNYDRLEAALNEIKPLTVLTEKTFLEKMFIPISLSGAFLFFATYYITNKTISIVCGALLAVIFAGSFVVVMQSKNVDKRTRRVSYLSLIVLVFVIYSLYNKIMS